MNVTKLIESIQNMKRHAPLKYNTTVKIFENCKAAGNKYLH